MYTLIIAHPDDEIIDGGFDLLTNQISKVICVTGKQDKIRLSEFHHVMKLLKIEYDISDFKDNLKGFSKENIKELEYLKQYDNIITHNEIGEYGHKQHIQLHQILKPKIVKVFKDN